MGQSTVNITGEVLVTNNSAKCQGGGIIFIASNIFASGNVSVFTNSADDGGGIVIQGGSGTLSNASFISNSARQGGGMVIQLCKSLIISGKAVFVNNMASINGGGISIIESINGSLNMTKNSAISFGGAIVIQDSEIFAYGALFIENVQQLLLLVMEVEWL